MTPRDSPITGYGETDDVVNNTADSDDGGYTYCFPSLRGSSPVALESRRPGDKTSRYFKGNVYVEVDDGQVPEKETVL